MGIIDILMTVFSGALFGLLYKSLVKLLDLKLFKNETKIFSKRVLVEAGLFGLFLAIWNELFFHFWPF